MEKDVSLEGAALLAYRPLSERTKLFFHAGGFIAGENSTSKKSQALRSTARRYDGTLRRFGGGIAALGVGVAVSRHGLH